MVNFLLLEGVSSESMDMESKLFSFPLRYMASLERLRDECEGKVKFSPSSSSKSAVMTTDEETEFLLAVPAGFPARLLRLTVPMLILLEEMVFGSE